MLGYQYFRNQQSLSGLVSLTLDKYRENYEKQTNKQKQLKVQAYLNFNHGKNKYLYNFRVTKTVGRSRWLAAASSTVQEYSNTTEEVYKKGQRRVRTRP
jgi:hypothetical protein